MTCGMRLFEIGFNGCANIDLSKDFGHFSIVRELTLFKALFKQFFLILSIQLKQQLHVSVHEFKSNNHHD